MYTRPVYFDTKDTISDENKSYTIVLTDRMGLSSTVTTSVESQRIDPLSCSESNQSKIAQNANSEYGTVTISCPTSFPDATIFYEVSFIAGSYSQKPTNESTLLKYNEGSETGSVTLNLNIGWNRINVFARKSGLVDSYQQVFDIFVTNEKVYVNADYTGNIENGSLKYPFNTIQEAINSFVDSTSLDNTILLLTDVVLTETITNKQDSTPINLNINGVDSDGNSQNRIISGNDTCRIMKLEGSVVINLNNLTLTNGTPLSDSDELENGGAIYVTAATLNINDTIIGEIITGLAEGTQASESDTATVTYYGNTASNGGGIYIESGKVNLLNNSDVAYNYSTGNGGGIYVCEGATLNLGSKEDPLPEIYANRSDRGAAIYSSGTVNIYGSIHHNSASNSSGIELGEASDISLSIYSGSSIRDNLPTTNFPGAIHTRKPDNNSQTSSGKITIYGGEIQNNTIETEENSNYISADIKIVPGFTLDLSGDTEIGSIWINDGDFTDNDNIYINVSNSLSNSKVSKIILDDYIIGTQIMSSSTGVDLANEVGKFTLESSSYFINTAGIVLATYVTANGNISFFDLIDTIPPTGDPITLSTSSIEITTDQTINANIILKGNSGSLFDVTSGTLTLSKGTFSGGSGNNCIEVNDGTLIIEDNCTITTNSDGYYGVQVNSGSFTMSGGTITGAGKAGIYVTDGSITITGGTITGNGSSSSRCGGIVLEGGSGAISNLEISNNKAKNTGGGLYIAGGEYKFTNCKFNENSVTGSSSGEFYGGGVYIDSSSANTYTFTDCIISKNSVTVSSAACTGYGGGIAINNGTGVFTGEITENVINKNYSASGEGDQIYVGSGASLTYNEVTYTDVSVVD